MGPYRMTIRVTLRVHSEDAPRHFTIDIALLGVFAVAPMIFSEAIVPGARRLFGYRLRFPDCGRPLRNGVRKAC